MAKRTATTDDSWLGRMAQATAAIDRPGDFCTSGAAADTTPGLDVAGLGPVDLPLSADQAERLKRHCEQAPCGKGVQTVVDTSVRRVWRLAPDRFTLANPAWEATVAGMVATLVVMLPSHYTGGELVVAHEGQEQVVDLGGGHVRPAMEQFGRWPADAPGKLAVTLAHQYTKDGLAWDALKGGGPPRLP